MSQSQSAARDYSDEQQMYDSIVANISEQAERRTQGDFIETARAIADRFIEKKVGDDRTILTYLLNRSNRGPHATYHQHSFDTDEGMGTLKALAASSLVSDVLAME